MLWSLSRIWVKLNILSFPKPRQKRSSWRAWTHFFHHRRRPGQSLRGFRSSPGTTSAATQILRPWATTGGRTGTRRLPQLISIINKGTRTLSPTTGGQWESPTGKPGRGRSRTSTSMPLGLSSSISSKTSSQVRWYKYIEKWVNKCRIPGPNPWHRVWLLELRDWAWGRGHRDAHWARGGRHGQVRPVLARPRHQEHHSRGLWSHGGGGDQGGRWHHPDKAGGDPSRWGGGSQGQECDPHPGQRLGRSLCARQHLHTSSFYKESSRPSKIKKVFGKIQGGNQLVT